MRPLLLALPISALLLVGCGGDDGDAASDTADATETTSVTETTIAPDETVAGDSGDTGDICAQLADLADIDPDALPTQADIDRVQAAAESAPAEIQGDLATVATIGRLIADSAPEALNDIDALAELEAAMTAPEVTAAAATLVAYSTDECGVDVPLFSSLTG